MAFLIMLDLFVAQKFGGEMELWDRLESRVDHASVGLFVTFLFILRLTLRYRYGAPSLPSAMPRWQVIAAQVGHSIMVYGLYDLAFADHDASFFATTRGVHEFCTNAMIVTILIHICAAIYHHFFVKDETTINMARFWMSKRS